MAGLRVIILYCLILVVHGTTNSTPHSYTGGHIQEHSYNNTGDEAGKADQGYKDHEQCELTVASFDWANVQGSMIIATFLFFSAITKLCFHHAGYLVTKIPESCLLIVLGTVGGTIFTFATDPETFPDQLKTLQPSLFFMVLLPPIVLEASYSLHNRVFFDNIASILVYAVTGTLIGCFFIGPSLYGLSYAGILHEDDQISFIHCMLFASIIVAVDPVAVLAIFQEVGVNSVLYFIVFGESLLNDAVTVVLYHTIEGMSCFMEEGQDITPFMYIIAIFKFFATSFGGIVIGIIFGTITSLLTKYTVETRVVEPLLLFSLAYLSYVTSELFHFSGIIGMTVCGLIQAQYAFHNISHKSYVTVKYFTRMASSASDSVIFLYLGINLVRTDHEFHIGFVLVTILLTLVARFATVYGLSAVLNRSRLRQITKREQLIMAYGGLRGAVAFSLVSLLTGKLEQRIQFMFMTTILVVIIFTVFIQGGTIKPLVALLDIATQEKQEPLLLFTELNANVTDHIMAGIEEVVGTHGQFFFYDWFIHLDDKYIKHILQRNPMRKDEKIMKLYEKIALKQHFATLNGTEAAQKFVGASAIHLDEVGPPAERTSISSLHRASDMRRGHRPSLLSQLTRYGNIEEPEHVDDIAYITPEMLDDEELPTVHQRLLSRQQTVIGEDLKDPQQLRLLLTKPGSNMDARELRSKVDMDDRSNLMFLLQEKNKRVERFKRSQSTVGNESAPFQGTSSAMATIPEVRGGQIIRRAGTGRRSSAMVEQRWTVGFTSVSDDRCNMRSRPAAIRKGGIVTAGPSANMFAPSNSLAQGIERQRRVQNTQSRMSDDEGAGSDGASDNAADDLLRKDKKKSDAKGGNTNRNNRISADSVFYSGQEEVQLPQGQKKRRDTVDEVLESIQNDSELDVEQGQGVPLAYDSHDSDWRASLPPVTELPEKESCVSLARQAAVTSSSDAESTEAESDELEQGLIIKADHQESQEDHK